MQAEQTSGSSAAADAAADFDRFVYLLSHDVRACVRALTVLPEWIEEDLASASQPIDPAVAENITMMKTQAGRLDRMLLDLLSYSRVGRKQDIVIIDTDNLLDEVVSDLCPPDRFRITRDIQIDRFEFGEKDAFLIFEALISNAVKHSGADATQIHISMREDGEDCVICVHDDGAGIPASQHHKVLEPLVTLHPRDVTEGSGMGLAIVKKIACAYGGDIRWSNKSSGDGTEAEVYFPLNRQTVHRQVA